MMAYHQRISQYRNPRRIDFDDPSTTKPPSLAKSAVLAALEEEEREKSRGTERQSRSRQPVGRKPPTEVSPTPYVDRETVLKINRRSLQRRHRSCDNVWPPRASPFADGDHHRRPASPSETPSVGDVDEREGLKRVAWPPPAEAPEYEVHPSQQQHAVGQQVPLQQQQQQYQLPPQQQQQPPQQYYHQAAPQRQQQPHPTYQQTSYQPLQQQQHPHQPVERIIPIQRPEDHQHQPLAPQYQNPLQQQPPQQQQQQQQPYQPQPTEAFQPLTSQQPPLYQPVTVPTQPHPQQPHPQQQQHQQQLPPTLVTTLRKEPPMSQEPAPVYQTQPVAAIYQGGSNMRGDQKWPPEEYKRQSEVDNEERRKLAQQPAFRPRRQQKDYGAFFAKNALNNTYPGYRAPPGTQHHD